MTASGRLRPAMQQKLQRVVEVARVRTVRLDDGEGFCRSAPSSGLFITPWRANIQFMLPRSVLISPLWAM
jgi:hypothetical protein